MPRPRKWRKVCCLPESNQFGPLNHPNNGDAFVIMTVDEYETIRLIDLEGFYPGRMRKSNEYSPNHGSGYLQRREKENSRYSCARKAAYNRGRGL